MEIVKKTENRASIIKELLVFFWANKLWWMIPFIMMLIIIGLLIIFAQSSPVLPFLYTAF